MADRDDGFPWFEPDEYFEFPDCSEAVSDGIVAVGGNLSPGMVLSAYRQGIFPWYSRNDPILWWSPDPRFVLYTEKIHVSRSMERFLARGEVRYTMDTAFDDVIIRCAEVPRAGQRGTWITADMKSAYILLHKLGYVHSCEAWLGRDLVGGLYGVCIGGMFFGESMFSLVSNASKGALVMLTRFLRHHDFDLIDSQQDTAHMASMGGEAVARDLFLGLVAERVERPGVPESWTQPFSEFLST